MVQRVTDNMLHDQALYSTNSSRGKLLKNQETAMHLKRVNRPSDDPVASTQVLRLRNDERRIEQFQESASRATNMLNMADRALEGATELLVRAQELAIGQASVASATPETRKAIAKEVEQLKLQMINVGNTRFGDRYLFAGFKTMTNPFDIEGNYKGDTGLIPFEVNSGYYIPVNIPGNIAFTGYGRNVIPVNEEALKTTESYLGRTGAVETEVKPGAEGAEKKNAAEKDPVAANSIERVNVPNRGVNIFEVFDRFIRALESNDIRLIQTTLDDWELAQNQVFMARASIGARVNSIDQTIQQLDTNQVDLAAHKSDLEDADIFEAFSALQKDEDVLKRTLATSQKLISTNLFDFLK